MVSQFNMVLLGLAALICVALYAVKYEAQDAEKDLRVLSRDIAAEREKLRLLRAEWALRAQPQRLKRLASKYLDLKPVRAGQIVSLSEVPFSGSASLAGDGVMVSAPAGPSLEARAGRGGARLLPDVLGPSRAGLVQPVSARFELRPRTDLERSVRLAPRVPARGILADAPPIITLPEEPGSDKAHRMLIGER